MRHGLSLLTLGIGFALFTAVGCGKDEATGSSGGHVAYCKVCSDSSDCAGGNVCRVVQGAIGVCAASTDTSCCDGPDGKGGSCYTNLGPKIDGSGGSTGGGILGGGGKAGHGGSGGASAGGTGNVSSGSTLGQACVKDTDCANAALTCVTNDGLMGGDGPAKGICTAACSNSNQCLEIADNSFCVPFSGTENYCVEGCTEGSLGVPKCHEREEVACNLIGLIPTTTACAANSDCGSGQICNSQTSVCGTIVTGCLPTCGGDYDCGSSQYCDFSTGFCVAQKPTGQDLGTPCTPAVGSNPDPCNGFCSPGSTDPTKGECSAFCALNSNLTGCGWDGKGPADNACLFGTALSGGDVAAGDLGICGKLCDCNTDCTLKGEYCVDETMGQVMSIWGRPGYCRPLQTGETVAADTFSKCPAGGTGGSGGRGGGAGEGGQGNATGGGTSGTNGESGQAGAGGQAGK